MITQLHLKNFTAFQNLEINFSNKINVIIGENGTGKTHLLKAAYALCTVDSQNATKSKESLTDNLLRLFQPNENKLGKLRRLGVAENADLSAQFSSGDVIEANFHTVSKKVKITKMPDASGSLKGATFFPTKEVLSLVHGMHHEKHHQQTVDWIFDSSYTDLSKRLLIARDGDPESDLQSDPRLASIILKLVNLIGGRYYLENGKFYFQGGEYLEKDAPHRSSSKLAKPYQDATIQEFVPLKNSTFPSNMTAEGFKKIGVLHRLLTNGELPPGGSGPLFWDEPESNLNPKLMKILVEILLELSRSGQQIILATHDYIFLKWLDLLADKEKGDYVEYHHLTHDDQNVRVNSSDSFSLISETAISDTFDALVIANAQSQLKKRV